MSGDQEKDDGKGKTSGSGFIGAVAGSGRPQPGEFQEAAEKALEADPDAFLRGAATTHVPSEKSEGDKSDKK